MQVTRRVARLMIDVLNTITPGEYVEFETPEEEKAVQEAFEKLTNALDETQGQAGDSGSSNFFFIVEGRDM